MIITLRKLKRAISDVLKKKYPDYKVYFDNVDKSKAPYFYVEMSPRATTVDRVMSDRSIQIDVELILEADAYGRVNRTALYEAADTIDTAFRPVFQVEDRMITINDTEITIVADILHYIFNLDFADCFTDVEIGGITYELMQHLGLEINKKNLTEEK